MSVQGEPKLIQADPMPIQGDSVISQCSPMLILAEPLLIQGDPMNSVEATVSLLRRYQELFFMALLRLLRPGITKEWCPVDRTSLIISDPKWPDTKLGRSDVPERK